VKFYGLYVLWEDPLIVSCLVGSKQEEAVHNLKASADVIYHPTWLWTYKNLPWFLKQKALNFLTNKKAHFACCSKQEQDFLSSVGLKSILSNISGYINERDFSMGSLSKTYDAIYAARMVDYKRMDLASEIKSLFVQTYGDCKKSNGEFDLHGFCSSLSHCDFNSSFVDKTEVVRKYQESKVGLALSEREGAMLAFVEYLLCGLPVVSTKAEGGREEFFDSRFVSVVDDNSSDVAKAVSELIAKEIDPLMIREATLEKLKKHRLELCSYVNAIIAKRGGVSPGEKALYGKWYNSSDGIFSHYVNRHHLLEKGFQLKDSSEQKS